PARKIEERIEGFDRPPLLRRRQRQHPGWPAEMDRRTFDDQPSVGSDLDGAPMLISEIEINVSSMLGDADVDSALGSIELRPRFQQIECRTDFSCARGLPSLLVIPTPQPGSKPLAPN